MRTRMLRKSTWALAIAAVVTTGAGMGPFLARAQDKPGTAAAAGPSGVPCQEVGQLITILLNTGTAGNGWPCPPDPIWKVQPPGGAFVPAHYTGIIGSWVIPPPGVNWIQPSIKCARQQDAAAGTFIYRAVFHLGCHPYLYDSIRLEGKISADNCIQQVVLNGQVLPTACDCNAQCFKSWRAVADSEWSHFLPGTNILDAHVRNSTSYTGFVAQLKVEAKCSKCCSPEPET